MAVSLQAAQKEHGATFATFFSVELPAHYRDETSEWTAVRRNCGVIGAGFRGLWRLNGADRAEFLQGMLSNEIRSLAPGGGTKAAYLTVQGRVVSDMRVLVLEEEIWLDVPVQRKAIVRETLEKYLVADDVEFVEEDAVKPLLTLEGPESVDLATSIFGADVGNLEPLSHREVLFDGEVLRVARVTHTGEEGSLVYGDVGAGATLWQRCCEAGAAPVGMNALDVLRIEAGIPWCDRDMDESVLAPEVGLEDAVSYKKGCYIGQEVVERVASRGQVQRKLVGLICEGDAVAGAGAKVIHEGKEAGAITSAAYSPALAKVAALAYIRRSAWEPDTQVQIEGGAGARVTKLPFYARSR